MYHSVNPNKHRGVYNMSNDNLAKITLSVFKSKPTDNYTAALSACKSSLIDTFKKSFKKAVANGEPVNNTFFTKILDSVCEEICAEQSIKLQQKGITKEEFKSFIPQLDKDVLEWSNSGQLVAELFVELLLDND